MGAALQWSNPPYHFHFTTLSSPSNPPKVVFLYYLSEVSVIIMLRRCGRRRVNYHDLRFSTLSMT
jgi:hypothetical protein